MHMPLVNANIILYLFAPFSIAAFLANLQPIVFLTMFSAWKFFGEVERAVHCMDLLESVHNTGVFAVSHGLLFQLFYTCII